MSLLLSGHLAVVAAYAGFQWTVQLVVYRQFPLVPTAAFVAYEQAHQRRISYVVGPLFAAQLVTSAALLALPPAGTPGWLRWSSATCLMLILALTAFRAVPEHRRLSRGFAPDAYGRLLRVDLLRALVATVNVGLAVLLLVRR